MLTETQRAFIAGYALHACGSAGHEPDPLQLAKMLDRLEAEGILENVGALPLLDAYGKQWEAAEEQHRNAKLAMSGVDLSKPMKDWTGAEWQQAVTVVAMHRFWAQREAAACNDLALSDLVQKSDQLRWVNDNAANIAREHFKGKDIPMVDPKWAGRLIRRMVKEALEATA